MNGLSPPAPGGDGTRADPLARAVRAFESRAGRAPLRAAAAPGRVNLIGEHTDYNGGAVLPIAIDRRTVIAVDRARGGASVLHAVDLDDSARARLADPDALAAAPPWARYLVAVGRELAALGLDVPEVDAVVASSVPIGAGLASSAALEVATAIALADLAGARLPPLETARLCRRAEHAACGVGCGIMDQFVATRAEPDRALLIDCRAESARPVPMPPPDRAAVLVVDTGVTHRLAASAYDDRRAACARAAARLGAAALCDAAPEAVERADLDPVERRRARHVVREHARTLRAAAALERGDADDLGDLMFESHESLRDDYEVSCPELDTVVETSRSLRAATGAVLGARMTGAGFGGCAIVLARPDAVDPIRARLAQDFRAAHARAPTIFRVRASSAAALIDLQRADGEGVP